MGIGLPPSDSGQDPTYMSCDELWYARNSIFARNDTASRRRARNPPLAPVKWVGGKSGQPA
jgi:hypothetical protein